MNPPITITAVIGRSGQGMTLPFICLSGSDEYYVKGAYAGLRSLCCEWVASRLVQLALPGAPLRSPLFFMGKVPRSLIEASGRSDIRDLGEGLVFASLRVRDGQELTWLTAQGWPEETMALLLLMDLWIQNEDRSLSEYGGNPNLLVEQIPPLPDDDPGDALWADDRRGEILWAYDFNNAFDGEFSRERFFGAHVFGGMLKRWPEGFRERMEPTLKMALAEVPAIFAELPLEWLHVDGDDSLPVQLDMESVMSVLKQPFTDPETFWKLP